MPKQKLTGDKKPGRKHVPTKQLNTPVKSTNIHNQPLIRTGSDERTDPLKGETHQAKEATKSQADQSPGPTQGYREDTQRDQLKTKDEEASREKAVTNRKTRRQRVQQGKDQFKIKKLGKGQQPKINIATGCKASRRTQMYREPQHLDTVMRMNAEQCIQSKARRSRTYT